MSLFYEYLFENSTKSFTVPGKKIVLNNISEFNPKILGMKDWKYGNNITVIGDIYLDNCRFSEIRGIKEIKGLLKIDNSFQLKSLGELEKVNSMYIVDSSLQSLGNLKEVGTLSLRNCKNLTNLEHLSLIKNTLSIRECPVKSIKNLIIKGDLFLSESLKDKIILPDRLNGEIHYVKNNFE